MTTRPFLGTTTDRREAFPNILSLELIIEQDPSEQYRRSALHYSRTNTFNLHNIVPHLRCNNPRCQQGGLELQQRHTTAPPSRSASLAALVASASFWCRSSALRIAPSWH